MVKPLSLPPPKTRHGRGVGLEYRHGERSLLLLKCRDLPKHLFSDILPLHTPAFARVEASGEEVASISSVLAKAVHGS